MKNSEKSFLAIIALLALLVVIQHVVIRTLRQQINNYAEECGDRTDAPAPQACGYDADGAAVSSGDAQCTGGR